MEEGSQERLCSGAPPAQVAADLEPLVEFGEEGLSLDELSRLVEERLVPHLMRYDRPSFQSMFNSFLEPGADLGARIALAYNQGVTNWQVSPGGAVLEELCGRALSRLFGLSPGGDCTFMYSGTYANHQAVYLALHRKAEEQGFDLAREGLTGFDDPSRLAVLTSVDAHFSMRHVVRVLGLGEKSLVTVGVDRDRRLDVQELEKTLKSLRGSRDIVCLVATAGTTVAGAVDPIKEMADLSEQSGDWLHVDGAYGLAYRLVPEWSRLFDGIDRADSVSWDPHKQLGVPIPSSVLFVRRSLDFQRMALFSSYFNLQDARQPNPGVKSMPSTRPLMALPLAATIRHQGLSNLAERLRAPLEAIRGIKKFLDSQPDMIVCHRPATGVLCFRVVPEGFPRGDLNRLLRYVYERILGDGRRTISVTELEGETALRLVAISPSVSVEALMETIVEVRRMAAEYEATD